MQCLQKLQNAKEMDTKNKTERVLESGWPIFALSTKCFQKKRFSRHFSKTIASHKTRDISSRPLHVG